MARPGPSSSTPSTSPGRPLMHLPAPRLHRLPQRLDYTLVPAPLDLSLPSLTEKSPLPAIIVTPSSPLHTKDFSIAFLAPPPKAPLRQRFASSINLFSEKSWFTQPRPFRTFFILAVLCFIMTTTYLINHRFTAYPYSPRFEMDITTRGLADGPAHLGPVPDGEFKPAAWDWVEFGFRKAWGTGGNVAIGDSVIHDFD